MKTIITILLTLCMFGSLQGQDYLPQSEQQSAQLNSIIDTNAIDKRIDSILQNFDARSVICRPTKINLKEMSGGLQGQNKKYTLKSPSWLIKMPDYGTGEPEQGQNWTVQKLDSTVCTSVDSLFMELDDLLFRSDLKQVQPFLRLWDRYEKECYNDSSISTIEYFTFQEDSSHTLIVGGDEYKTGGYCKSKIDTIWIHKTKPTHQDFVEWLNKQ